MTAENFAVLPGIKPVLVLCAENTVLEFKGMLSTSNVIVADEVVVTSDSELVWMTELQEET